MRVGNDARELPKDVSQRGLTNVGFYGLSVLVVFTHAMGETD